MAEPANSSTRLPRGTKPVAQAFLAALDAVPEASRPSVAKAAQIMIRDELKARREKLRQVPKPGVAKPAKKSTVQPKAVSKTPAQDHEAVVAQSSARKSAVKSTRTPKVSPEAPALEVAPSAVKPSGRKPRSIPVET